MRGKGDGQGGGAESHLFIAQVSLVEGDTGQLVALPDVEHRHRVSPLHQLLRQVSAQETRPPDDGTTFVTLCGKRRERNGSRPRD